MTEPTREQPVVSPQVTTRSPWHISRIPGHLGRARMSTVVLGVLFVAIFALYMNIRPDTGATTSGTTTPLPVTTTAPATKRAPATTTAESTHEQPTTTSVPTSSAPPTDTTPSEPSTESTVPTTTPGPSTSSVSSPSG